MLNKKLIGAAIALSLGFTSAAHAFSVNTGFSTLGNVGGFDWAPDSALGVNSLPLNGIPKAFTVYSQASLSSYLPNVGSSSISDTNLNTKYQITYVIGFGEIGTQFGLNASFDFDPSQVTATPNDSSTPDGIVNFFRVYYTDLTANAGSKVDQLAGTCYDGTCAGQKLILDGVIVADDSAAGGSNFTTGNYRINSLTAAGNINQNGGITNNAGWGTKKTLSGSGANSAVIDLNAANQGYAFFNGLDLGFTTLSVLDSLAKTPFSQATPSQKVAGQTVNLAGINGLASSCVNAPASCDFLFQNDSSQKMNTVVPEPGALALMGLGILGIGLARRKKSA